jgi:hypothetical protein
VYGDRLTAQRLDDEIAHYPAVVGVHPWAVGVEDPHNLDAQVVLPVVVEEQGLGATNALVVARTDADRVDVSPVVLGLRVDLRATVDLTGGRLQDPAFTRFARPSMLMAPWTLVLVVCTGSYW